MSTKQRIELLSLSGQLVTAAPGILFLNGVAITGGGTDGITISGNLAATGHTLYVNCTNLSGTLATTGQQAWTAADNNGIALSGSMRRPESLAFSLGATTWAAMPGSGAFFLSNPAYVTYLDLTQFSGVNLVVNRTSVAGAATGCLYLAYSTTFAMTPATYSRLDTRPTNTMLPLTNTVVQSGFSPIAATARSGVYIALIGSGGGALSPTFGNIVAQFL